MVIFIQAHGSATVLSSILPVDWLGLAEQILFLNTMIKTHAKEHGCIYLDYCSAMADERNYYTQD